MTVRNHIHHIYIQDQYLLPKRRHPGPGRRVLQINVPEPVLLALPVLAEQLQSELAVALVLAVLVLAVVVLGLVMPVQLRLQPSNPPNAVRHHHHLCAVPAAYGHAGCHHHGHAAADPFHGQAAADPAVAVSDNPAVSALTGDKSNR